MHVGNPTRVMEPPNEDTTKERDRLRVALDIAKAGLLDVAQNEALDFTDPAEWLVKVEEAEGSDE